jgi:hypothetical protein
MALPSYLVFKKTHSQWKSEAEQRFGNALLIDVQDTHEGASFKSILSAGRVPGTSGTLPFHAAQVWQC